MTDFSSKDNLYYSILQYNDTSSSVPCAIDIPQNFPLLFHGSNYSAGVNKSKFDLSTIPLTNSNIGFQKYSIILRNGTAEGQAYVRQVNSSNLNYFYNLSQSARTFYKYSYDDLGNLTLITSYTIPIGVANTYGQFAIDEFENLYLLTNTTGGTIFNALVIYSITGTLLNTYSFLSAVCIAIGPDQNVYVGDNGHSPSPAVEVFTNDNSSTAVSLTGLINITQNKAGSNFTNVCTISVDSSSMLIGYGTNNCTFYDPANYTPITDFTASGVTQLSAPSTIFSEQDRFVLDDDGIESDFIFGYNSSSTEIVNVISGGVVEASTATYNQACAPVIQTDNSVFGIGSDTHTYKGTYSPSLLTISSVSNIDSSIALNGTMILPDGNNFVSYNSSSKLLYGWNLDNLTNNAYTQINSGFDITSLITADVACYQHLSVHNLYAVGSDNNFYRTTMYPKMFFANGTSDTVGYLEQFGTGYNTPSTTTSIGTQLGAGALSSDNTNPAKFIGCYRSASGNFIACSFDSVNKLWEQEFNPQTLALITTTPLSIDITSPQICGPLAHSATNYIVLTAYDTGASEYVVGIFEELAAGAPTVPTPVFSQVIAGATSTFCQSNLITYGGVTYLIVMYFNEADFEVKYDVYDVTDPTSVTTIITAVSTLGLIGMTSFVICPNLIGGDLTIYWVASTQQLIRMRINSSTFALIDGLQFITPLVYDQTCNIGIATNTSLPEIYIKLTNNDILVFNYTSGTQTSTITTNGISNFIYMCGDQNGTLNWSSAITSTGLSGHPTSLVASQNNVNTFYCINSGDNKPYQANYTGAFTWTKINDNTYTSIGTTKLSGTLYNSTALCYKISDQSLVGTPYNATNLQISAISTNKVTSEFMMSVANTGYVSFSSPNFTMNYSQSDTSIYEIQVKDGDDVNVGKVPIYDYAVLINAINDAFQTAYNRMIANGGSGMVGSPTMSFDSTTLLLTLEYPSPYTDSGNGILFNYSLLQLCNFPSTSDTTDLGYYLLTLPSGSTGETQTNRSFYIFNQLDKIVVTSQTFGIIGSIYGNNSQNQALQDFDIPISTTAGNQGEVLYVQPNFITPLIIGSGTKIDRLQVAVYYQYLNGDQFPLLLAPNTNWTTKLQWMRKF